ncbi:hypothetical protein BJP34_13495 [Moorena producens PAL-8-15-08-1]|uniref:Carrier domain-containing protein n=1 Tax=Moorena producens PAL-8-15-08-1 TaxID=1458985 RepID=A0A1D8TRZ4_9CYAN|nr:non-ribosomal peptide synthetase [Moorena producens]AOX00333.1 hypothetical protein BJP34_13495 [Moorena producens PAL-8-15-08-1]
MNPSVKPLTPLDNDSLNQIFEPFPLEHVERSIVEQFEQQVSRHGNRLAIGFPGQDLTYNALNQWANRIARAVLTKLGAGSQPVALLFETGPSMMAAMLGVLKAGKFYVPLDISLPESRLSLILNDSKALLILSDRYHLDASGFEQRILSQDVLSQDVLRIDSLEPGISEENLDIQYHPDDLAYILYTSGSTGRPKGVLQNHRYVLNLCRNYSNSGKMTFSDRFSLLYSAAFGGAVRDIYCALLNGAALFPLDVKQIGLHQLAPWLRDHEITVMFAVATLFRHFVSTLDGLGNFPKLRLIQIGSETVYRQDAELFVENFSDQCTLMVNLGGTEISPVRQFPITKETMLTGATVPAGYGVEGTEVFLWDESGQEVPPGEVGEIVVRSRQVALGYWQQPERTEQVFITDGEHRYFKTGDNGKLLPDGCLLHLGRLDFQVKIRGYRVETTEVEASLLNLDPVQEAVVVAQAEAGGAVGDQQLVAYLTPVNSQNRLTANELKAALGDKLPSYMVPACFIWLESLPLTVTGKIDRRALPKPESILSTSQLELNVIAPRTETEETLVKIWSEVLKIEPIGIENNFLELGGHSLHASQVVARISNRLGIEVPLKQIFEAPTISLLSNYLETVNTSTCSTGDYPLVPTPTYRVADMPLSLTQQGMWFLAQLEDNRAAYNLARAFVITGSLDRTSLENAFAKRRLCRIATLIDRHEILRTTFEAREGMPFQRISSHIRLPLSIVDLATEGFDGIEEVILQEQNHPFDVTVAPLLRFTLICLGKEKQILLLTMHHIISDDWSIQVLLSELSSLYKAGLTQTPPSLPALPIQYVDYAAWQRHRFTGEFRDSQIKYWQEQLADATPVLNLPLDRPRTTQPFKSGRVPFHLNGDLTQKLNVLSQGKGTTLFITLFAAFSAFLSRYCHQDDIVVGTPIANRTPAITEALIGFFVNTLVLRTRPNQQQTFIELLSQVRQVALDAYAHADVPFDLLVEQLKPERLPGVSPLFQVMFTLQNVPKETLDLPGLTVSAKSLDKPTAGATFDLTLSLTQSNRELIGAFEYNANLFDRATIERMARNFQIFVEGITLNPEQPIAQLPILSAAERQQLLVEWNQTQTDYPRTSCVHQLFEAIVQNTPDAVAVVLNEQTLTYRQLNQQANQLAHYLLSLGVGQQSLVGVCLERSPHLIIALLAILKAGGAYLPLDPTYPSERLAFMVDNAALKVIVTETGVNDNLPQVDYSVNLDIDGKTIAAHPTENLNAPATATSLAYVMYTSGSTGQPKGVSITHRNIVRLVKNTNYAQFTANDVVLQLASISFDAAPWEIWGSLLNGACLVLFPEQQISLEVLGQVMRQHQVTIVLLTTGLFHLVVDEGLEDLRSLRLLVTGGDVLSVSHAHKCRQALPHCELINAYGPTENTTITSWYSIPTRASFGESMPIGRPIANTRVYILDGQQQPVPIGVVGELYTGGDGVARGYLNRQELNAERFISSPFLEDEILYKTGDQARYLPDGNIEFLGRIDSQVKIRGFRIELSEIETVISQYPQVQQAMVMVRDDRPGDKYLVAYVKGIEERAFRAELRHFLQQKLPDYMVPNAIVGLDSFPLTPNGKVDRRKLPAPDFEQERSTDFVAPSTPVETVIGNIIATVLGQERVGIHDNFFALGGHSLLATQVISRIRHSFGVELPLKVIFEQPTLVGLAQAVDLAVKDNLVPLPAIEPIPRTEPLPLSFAQQRLWFLDRLEGASPSYNIPSAYKLEGNLNRVALEESLQTIVQRHENLRTIFKVGSHGVPFQYISDTVTITLPVIELTSGEQESQVQDLIKAEAQQSFDIAKDRLIRFKLLQLSPTEHVLLVTMHHIISDGWSMGVFWRELCQLYQAFCEGKEASLPPLKIQYGDFAYWQRQWLAQQVLNTQLDYWKQQLAGIPPLLELPTDYPRPARQTFRGCRERFKLDSSLTQKLKQLSQKAGVTLFMTLLAAFDVLLCRYSGQTDIVVGSPIANRNQAEIEPLIGFFVNTLVLRSDLSGNPSFFDLLTQVRKTTLEAYTHQDLPFEKLVEELQPERRLDSHPVVQVVFALQNAPRTDLDLPGLKAEAIKLDTGATREFDLELHLWDHPEGLSGLCLYSSDLFKTETIQRMLGHFQTLLQGVIAESSQAIGQLPLLTPAERQQLLVEWNQTQTDYPRNTCVHQLFETQVQKTPDAIAVVFNEQTLTYWELNQQANQLAHYLLSLGVGQQSLVGVCLERSPNLIIALLAILKSGAAYLPLDPTYPPERLAFMVENAGLKVILTETGVSDNLPQVADYVNLNTQAKTIAAHPKQNLNTLATATSLAYVMYTSGSTGQPKGVKVTHQNIVRLVRNTNYAQFTTNDVFLQLASVSFDAATWEIWGSLLNGSRLVLFPEPKPSLEALGQVIQQYQVTALWLTAGLFHLMVDERLEDLQSLRLLMAGGDVLSVSHVQKCCQALPHCQLINGYGPTENTTFTCCYPVPVGTVLGQSVPIGRPIANTQVYILDHQQQPVPIGLTGELYVGGDGLARGYWNRPALTAERFISNPFVEGEQLYKTGDKARYLPDGNIEFLGRSDSQVKIRGFRIELAEIEATLGQHPAIAQNVVSLQGNKSGDKSLMAYLALDWTGKEISELIVQAETELLSDWQNLYEQVYEPKSDDLELDFNILGWNSSYSGQPIPSIEMQEWLETTVARINTEHPQSVLEIGCGTGLLINQIAPNCKRYHGTDYSSAVLDHTKRLQQAKPSLDNVILHHKLAHDFEGIPQGEFDTVILNSIVQYFPSIDYLLQVLEGAIEALDPKTNSRIFVGDVRNGSLLDAFHTLVQFIQAEQGMTLEELKGHRQRSLCAEEELVIAPSFFVALPQYFPQINHVEIQPKRGKFQNELTQFRYDVTLYIEPIEAQGQESNRVVSQSARAKTGHMDIPWQDWQKDSVTLAKVRRTLAQQHPDYLGIVRIPNARVEEALKIQQCLDDPTPELKTVEHLRQYLSEQKPTGIEPDLFWQLGEELGYEVRLSWWEASSTGCYDVAFIRHDLATVAPRIAFWQWSHGVVRWHDYGNIPLRGKVTDKLLPQVRQFLQGKLPEYMVPQQFIVLEHIPLTPNGKVDRQALPRPETVDLPRNTSFVAPTTPTQELLATIWTDVLKIEHIGLEDNFFELGGHSLLGTQVISRIRHSFGVELPLKVMFEQPTLVGLALAVEVAQKDNLVPLPAIEPIPRTEPLPLSFAQQRLWFLHQLEGASSSYNMFSAWKLEGNLDQVALERSLQAIVQRHENLRTIFKVDSHGVPYQYITDTVTVTLPVIEVNSGEQKAEVKDLIQAEAQESFDLAKDRLIRFKLLQLSSNDHVLLVTMHHIISDGWSIGVFRRELCQLYHAFCAGQGSPLTPLKIQYGDFAYWQRQWLADQVLKTQLDYWKQQLAGIPPLLELPTDYPRPARQTFRGNRQHFQFDASLTRKLKELSQKAGVTMFMTLLAAFDVLLCRYSGQTDIVIGSPIANRNQAEIEPLIGFFVNTLVLRTDLGDNPSFEDLLTQVRKTTLEAYTHQDLPFEKLVEELQPERSLNHHPLVQVVFALQNLPTTNLELPSLKAEPLKLETEKIREFDLELHLYENQKSLSGFCVYSSDLFNTETIQRMLGHLQTLLEAIVEDSSQKIGELPLLSPAEQQKILVDWNQTQQQKQLFTEWDLTPSEMAEIPLILPLLEKRAQHNADRIAVKFQDWQLSYQVLHERANQLAHYLQTIGVGPEVIVGVCAERSPELVVIFLGILKAGGAYLPLDPAYPQDRLGYMLADAQVSVLLTQPHLVANLPPHQAQVVTLEGEADAIAFGAAMPIAAQPKTPPTTVITSDNLAYVIYTSGSTGRPKGVMITHKGLGNLAANLIKTFAITATSRVLQFASPSFDASIMEMLMALGADACLCSGTSESLLTGSNLIGFLNEEAISHALLAPSALAVLKPETLPNLEVLIVGGEACPVSLMKQWAKGRHFFNAYGPTEATICTTIAPCQPEDETITIGSPLANTEIYILDTYGQPVPIGVPGELHIGGIGLAKGYLNRRDLTQEKFVEIKGCEALTGKRLYKTGDRVRYHCDGSIEFLGRIDHQVKLRGFRIELGEVSATLEKHPAVQAAIALVREDRPGDKHLVAYVIGQDDYCEISPTELREFLRGQLPNYMVPTAVVLLSEFPLTPNGKLDRHALPPPLLGKARSQKLPKTEVEHKIAAIWQQILTVEVVGLDDNFFELGGHSLLLAQLQQQLQDCFGTDIPIVELFARPTVGTLAEFFSSPAVLSTGQPTETESKQQERQRVSKLRKRQQQIRGRYQFRGDT